MPMDHESSALAFFVRTSQNLKILTLGKPSSASVDSKLTPKDLAKLPHVPKSASWSPDSQSLAVGDTVKGVVIIGLRKGKPTVQILAGSSVNTQHIWWSPTSKYLVTQNPPEKVEKGEKPKPNLLVWSAETQKILAEFCVPKGDGSKRVCPLLWSHDERVCVRILPPDKNCKESVLHLLPGNDLNASPLFEIREERAQFVAQWARPEQANGRSGSTPATKAKLALFVSDGRNEMQRVSSPAELRLYELDVESTASAALRLVKKVESQSGESAELQWSASGDAVLALIETEVDETGVSYYGSTRLLLLPTDKEAEMQELNKDADGKYTPIQAVAWSPANDLFVLIRGFQPAHVSLWSYDQGSKSAKMIATLAEKAHRNSVKWNKFGSVCLIGGYGNLAGEMDFWGRTEDKTLRKMSTAQANCTVSVDWAADGIHVITAVLAPRMRVENSFTIWNCLTGQSRHTEPFEELYEVGLRPHDETTKFEGPALADIKNAVFSKVEEVKPKRMAYRPPHARGQTENNNVKAMMLGVGSSSASSPRNGGTVEAMLGMSSPDKKRGQNGSSAAATANKALNGAGATGKETSAANDGTAGAESSGASGSEQSGGQPLQASSSASGGTPAAGATNSRSISSGDRTDAKNPGRADQTWLRGQVLPEKERKSKKSSADSQNAAEEISTATTTAAKDDDGDNASTPASTRKAPGGQSADHNQHGEAADSGEINDAKMLNQSSSSSIPGPPPLANGSSSSSATSGGGPPGTAESATPSATGTARPTAGGPPTTAPPQHPATSSTATSSSYQANPGGPPPHFPGMPPPAGGGGGKGGMPPQHQAPYYHAPPNGMPPQMSQKGAGGMQLPPGAAPGGGYVGAPPLHAAPPAGYHHPAGAIPVKGVVPVYPAAPGAAAPGHPAYMYGPPPLPGAGPPKGVLVKGGYPIEAYPPGAVMQGKGGALPPQYLPPGAGGKVGVPHAAGTPPHPGQPPNHQPQAGPAAHQQHQHHLARSSRQECPKHGWQYVDPKGLMQGPFDLDEMQQWHQLGYFKPELKMRFCETMDFVPFQLLFPHPTIPFESYPMNVPQQYNAERQGPGGKGGGKGAGLTNGVRGS